MEQRKKENNRVNTKIGNREKRKIIEEILKQGTEKKGK